MDETTQVSRWNKPVSELTTKDQLIMSGVVTGAFLGTMFAYGVAKATVNEIRVRRAANRELKAQSTTKDED